MNKMQARQEMAKLNKEWQGLHKEAKALDTIIKGKQQQGTDTESDQKALDGLARKMDGLHSARERLAATSGFFIDISSGDGRLYEDFEDGARETLNKMRYAHGLQGRE